MKLTQDSLMSSFTSQSKIRCLEVKKKKKKRDPLSLFVKNLS